MDNRRKFIIALGASAQGAIPVSGSLAATLNNLGFVDLGRCNDLPISDSETVLLSSQPGGSRNTSDHRSGWFGCRRMERRPGKPTVFGRLGHTLLFGLPGNPVSVAVTFNLFARTALRAMQGAQEPVMKEETAVLARDLKGSIERESYLPAVLRTDEKGTLLAEPLKWGGSSDFVAFARATALIDVPAGAKIVDAGTPVKIVRLPG